MMRHKEDVDKIKNSTKKIRIENNGSMSLTSKENEELLKLLEYDQYAICSGVARIFKTNKNFSPGWEMIGRGIIVYIKDYSRKLYILKLFCLPTKRCIWEYILYTNFMPVFGFERIDTLEFESEGIIYCINYSHHSEAQLFYTLFRKKYERDGNCHLVQDNLCQLLSGHLSNPQIGLSSISNNEISGNDKKLLKSIKNNKKKKGKINKNDISSPTNFSHLVHIGWRKDEDLSNVISNDGNNKTQTNIDQSVKDLLKAAGFDYKKMKEKDLNFAKDFVKEYEKGKNKNKIDMMIDNNYLPSPLPASNNRFQNVNIDMVPTSVNKQQVNICRRPPPPIPPPLPSSMERKDKNNNLDNCNKLINKNDNTCNNLMDQIKQGKILNHINQDVINQQKNKEDKFDPNGSLTEALRKIMNERRRKVSENNSSSSVSSSSSEEWI